MAFDLLISRDPREAVRPELGTVLVEQMGADRAALATLLEEGRVLLRMGVDFAYASWCARSLAAVGAVVELLPAGAEVSSRGARPAAPIPSAVAEPAAPAAEPATASGSSRKPPVADNPLGVPLTIASGDLGPFAHQVAPDAFAVSPDDAFAAGPFAPVPPPPSPLQAPPPRTAAPPPPADPFAPSPTPDAELTLDVPAAAPPPATPALPRSFDVVARRPSSGNYAAAQRSGRSQGSVRAVPKPVVRTCERCGSLVSGEGECPRCAAGYVPPPDPGPQGLRGTLRARAPLRYGLGFALALGAGYLVQAPYARRAESRVVLVRQEADAQRYRFDAQVQARVRTLDDRAKDEAESAALWSAILWLVTAAVVFAGWLWLT